MHSSILSSNISIRIIINNNWWILFSNRSILYSWRDGIFFRSSQSLLGRMGNILFSAGVCVIRGENILFLICNGIFIAIICRIFWGNRRGISICNSSSQIFRRIRRCLLWWIIRGLNFFFNWRRIFLLLYCWYILFGTNWGIFLPDYRDFHIYSGRIHIWLRSIRIWNRSFHLWWKCINLDIRNFFIWCKWINLGSRSFFIWCRWNNFWSRSNHIFGRRICISRNRNFFINCSRRINVCLNILDSKSRIFLFCFNWVIICCNNRGLLIWNSWDIYFRWNLFVFFRYFFSFCGFLPIIWRVLMIWFIFLKD